MFADSPRRRAGGKRGVGEVKVRVYPFRETTAHGNIVWPGKFPANGGRFPVTHPCAARTEVFRADTSECGDGAALKSFRERGYWASCFPEGDGITWKPMNGQSDAQCLADIRECFGWEADWAKGFEVAIP